MIKTLSLCPTCYKKIEARVMFRDGGVWMEKDCNAHGHFEGLMEKSQQHFTNFYELGTMGKNNTVIVHAHDKCNMQCEWCYYPMGKEPIYSAKYIDTLLGYGYRGHNLLLSGGEPTIRPDYFDYVKELRSFGWEVASITNMINLGDREFFKKTLNDNFLNGKNYKFAMSFQHPKNYDKTILAAKHKAIDHILLGGLRAACCMFSIQSLDELAYIREFYNETKQAYGMLRIRTMFDNWANKGEKQLYLSELYDAFMETFGDLCPTQSRDKEHSNIYCLYMRMDEGIDVTLSSAPTVENVDYHMCSRPTYMLALDQRCYPVPLCQIINEGIDKGWKDGFELKGGMSCII